MDKAMQQRWALIIPAAGKGLRFGSVGVSKQFLEVAGRSLLAHTLDRALSIPAFGSVIVTLSQGSLPTTQSWLTEEYGADERIKVVVGGASRQESVALALAAITADSTDLVFVHDAVRPMASEELYARVARAAFETGAAIPCLAVMDTIKMVNNNAVVSTLSRDDLRRVQTPQAFRLDILVAAHAYAVEHNVQGTDDASLVEMLGKPVTCVEGEETNVKVTTPSDLQFVEWLFTLKS